ncbi:MAG: two-component sensor histidine kinase [Marmoricola sp.]|jgi:signal transduction histidine kinase|nr:two-component sensor histidine kinase [Marmoricola sp.]
MPAAWISPGDLPQQPSTGPGTSRGLLVDAAGCLAAAALGALFLTPDLRDSSSPLSTTQFVVDISCGALACISLWWRRRWPLGVALACAALGMVSTSATPAGLLALSSLAVYRPLRPVLLVAVLWIPCVLVFAAYSPTTGPIAVFLLVTPLVVAAIGWGMFLRARRQLLQTLRERATRAENDQRLHEERARTAERTRIAREMHDVLAHRISLLALHAGGLEVRPDLPAEKVRETAELMRMTARQALEELRGVIGVLREEAGQDPAPPAAPQPTLSDIRRLVEETRLAGARIDLQMVVDPANAVPSALGRDAYRIVQEALTNIGKHASGSTAWVQVTGGPEKGLHVIVRNRRPLRPTAGPTLPGSGAGLLGLQERVALAGGTLVHGPDASGDFIVDAELQWQR